MDEETKKCVCTDACDCKCNDCECGCCEKKGEAKDEEETEAE